MSRETMKTRPVAFSLSAGDKSLVLKAFEEHPEWDALYLYWDGKIIEGNTTLVCVTNGIPVHITRSSMARYAKYGSVADLPKAEREKLQREIAGENRAWYNGQQAMGMARLGFCWTEGIEECRVVIVPGTGREIRKTPNGWECQPPDDNCWKEFDDLIEAMKFATGKEASGALRR